VLSQETHNTKQSTVCIRKGYQPAYVTYLVITVQDNQRMLEGVVSLIYLFLNPVPPHVPYGLRGLPPGCG
jgi:hypothetical protein